MWDNSTKCPFDPGSEDPLSLFFECVFQIYVFKNVTSGLATIFMSLVLNEKTKVGLRF